MATIAAMRKLGKSKQISFPSEPGIVSRLDFAAARLALSRDFGGNKLRTGHLVNALALWLGGLSDDELTRFAGPKLRALEEYLGLADADETPELETGRARPMQGASGPIRAGERERGEREAGETSKRARRK